MDKLDGALAELAKQLGVGVGELWSWLTDGALGSYARMRVLKSVPWLFILVLLCVAMLVCARAFFRKRARDMDDWCFAGGGCVVAAIIAALTVAFIASETVGWLVEPQGMLLDMLVSKIG